MPYREVNMDPELKRSFIEWARDRGASQSELVREIIADYGKGETRVTPPSGSAIIRFQMDDVDFLPAKSRAEAEGVSMSVVVRRAIAEILDGE